MTPSSALAAVERLDREATPGPWYHDEQHLWGCCTSVPGGHGTIVCTMGREGCIGDRDREDARLIATYRIAAPILAARVRELEEEVKHWRTLYSEAVEAGRAVAFEAGEKGGE